MLHFTLLKKKSNELVSFMLGTGHLNGDKNITIKVKLLVA